MFLNGKQSESSNVRSVKKHTKHSSVLLLCLVCFFTERTLHIVKLGLDFKT